MTIKGKKSVRFLKKVVTDILPLIIYWFENFLSYTTLRSWEVLNYFVS